MIDYGLWLVGKNRRAARRSKVTKKADDADDDGGEGKDDDSGDSKDDDSDDSKDDDSGDGKDDESSTS